MSILLTTEDVREKHANSECDVAIIDVRKKSEYMEGHIPSALYLDVKLDLTGEQNFLPDHDRLAATLSRLGISNKTTLVFYDDGTHRAASKAWFVLNYLGHEEVYLLEGGFASWLAAGHEADADLPKRETTTYEAKPRKELVLTIDQVKDRLQIDESTLIDSRSNERYTGEVEPKYKKAGHIPRAKNFHSKQVFDEKGLWKDRVALKKHFARLEETNEVVVSCGSGNSACMNVVALTEAGFTDVKLYPGGFSEWIEDDRNEVRQGTE